jgi:peroxiredoxin
MGALLLASLRNSPTNEPDPRHWITADIRKQVAALAKTPAPTFTRTDTDGERIDLRAELAKKPVFLIFIMDGCPCSYEAQPFFQRLYAAYGDKVEFIAITDGTMEQAKEWKAHFQMVYPVISEPKKELMHLYRAIHSAYTALLTEDEGVVQMWPGYSQAELESISGGLSKASGKRPKVDLAGAPHKPTTGCVF